MTATPAAPKARHIPIREEWLALRTEPVLDPARPIVDPHHHLWDKPGNRYLLDEIAADIAFGHNVVATVFVEAREHYRTDGPAELRSLGETEAIAAIARESEARFGGRLAVAAGIVGQVDMTLGEAAGPILDRHLEAGDGRFRGVRHTVAHHADPEARGSVISPPPGLLYDTGFRRGLAELARRGLSFDAWAYHTQLGEVADLAHAMPSLPIVLDHHGGPLALGPYEGRRREVFEDWRHFMRKLARYPNVTVKLGGSGMLMAGFGFEDHPLPPTSEDLATAWGPYMLECIDAFGANRCMFESNFPVDKGTTSYLTLWNAFKRIAAGASQSEADDLFFQTANRTYGLGLQLPTETPKAPRSGGGDG